MYTCIDGPVYTATKTINTGDVISKSEYDNLDSYIQRKFKLTGIVHGNFYNSGYDGDKVNRFVIDEAGPFPDLGSFDSQSDSGSSSNDFGGGDFGGAGAGGDF